MAITIYQVKISAPGLIREYTLDCLNEYGFPGFIHDDFIDIDPGEEVKVKQKRLAWYQPNFKCADGCCFKDAQERDDCRIDLENIIKVAKAKNILVHKGHPNPGERDLDIEDRKELRLQKEAAKNKITPMSYSLEYAHDKTVSEKLS